ncbi:hypothetical protein LY76DRAFT_197160 [Colletotrichum caudatum]|nr:hypothetical protein LY76DRAFT_197160 [Colletotrichum caudatum]
MLLFLGALMQGLCGGGGGDKLRVAQEAYPRATHSARRRPSQRGQGEKEGTRCRMIRHGSRPTSRLPMKGTAGSQANWLCCRSPQKHRAARGAGLSSRC